MSSDTNNPITKVPKQHEFDADQERCTPEEKLEEIINGTKRRLKHAQNRLARTNKRQSVIKENNGKLTEHGGWDRGYWEGKIASLEDSMDDLNELKMMLKRKGV
ncbi:uncharacterized protein (DUF342 family) [Rossellomorea marisflavi]